MAKKGEPEKPVESDSESGEEEASSEEIGSDDSNSEPEQTQVAKKPTSLATQKKTTQPQSASKPQQHPVKVPSSSSEDDEDEDSGSESESESDGPPQSVKPIASKPMDDPPASEKRSKSRPSAAEVVTPTKSTTASKRAAEEKPTETKDGKKSRKKTDDAETSEKKPVGEDSKKLLFQRLWSENDEIEILEGLINYTANKKSDPLADLAAFHDYIRENLHVDVTRAQLQDKIRRLKRKFGNNLSKEKAGKKGRTVSKSHDLKAYELSKLIWGSNSDKESNGEQPEADGPKANGGSMKKASVKKRRANVAEIDDSKAAKKTNVSIDEKEKVISVPVVKSSGNLKDRIVKIGTELFESGEGLEGEKEWKRLKIEEFEVHLKELDVRRAQVKLVLDALKAAEQ